MDIKVSKWENLDLLSNNITFYFVFKYLEFEVNPIIFPKKYQTVYRIKSLFRELTTKLSMRLSWYGFLHNVILTATNAVTKKSKLLWKAQYWHGTLCYRSTRGCWGFKWYGLLLSKTFDPAMIFWLDGDLFRSYLVTHIQQTMR